MHRIPSPSALGVRVRPTKAKLPGSFGSGRSARALVTGGFLLACAATVAFPASAVWAATPGTGTAPSTASGSGWIRFGHFVPSEGPVTVTVDGAVLGSNIVFRAVTPYLSVPAGTHTVTVRSSASTSSSPALAVGQADVASGGAVTAAAVAAPGSTSSSDAAGDVQLQMFTDD